jgi:hypothetical protein
MFISQLHIEPQLIITGRTRRLSQKVFLERTVKIDFATFYLYVITLTCKFSFMNNLIYGKDIGNERRGMFVARMSAEILN